MNSVLVVDNEPEIRSTLCMVLSGEGFNAHQATNGREAIDKYRQSPADVVITDMRMPELDGHEVIRRLKQLDEHVAAIMLTAHDDVDDHLGGIAMDGIYNYLSIPLKNPKVLIAAVKGAIENRRLKLENKMLLSKLEAAGKIPKAEMTIGNGVSDVLNENLTRRQLIELESLYRSAPFGMCQIDGANTITKANAAMAVLAGIRLEDLQGKAVDDVLPHLAQQLLPVCHRINKTGTPVTSQLIRMPGNNDHVSNYWLVNSYPPLKGNGELAVTSHFFQDITDLRQAQEHIRLSKKMLQSVFDGISDPLLMVDPDFKVRMLNRAAKCYYQIKDYKDVLGKKCQEIFHNEFNCRQCKIPQAVSSGRALVYERFGHMAEDRVEKVTIYPLSVSVTGLDGSIIQITDVTETKAIERQFIQNEKLAALGLLVSGVAHEINNPNNFITFNIPILQSYIKALLAQISNDTKNSRKKNWFGMTFNDFSDEIFKLIRNLDHGTHRIADIVDNLRLLVKAQAGGKARQRCDMVQIVRHVEALCRREVQQFVKTFEVQCPENLPPVLSDAAALEQILINLLINAAHAANKPDSKIVLSVAIHDHTLKLVVEDNGAGMDDDTLKRIFDPFFTTKAPGLGTGLGLSVCHSLVNAMNGTLKVKSALDSGTVFNVELPVDHADGSRQGEDSSERFIADNTAASPVK